ncbi:hypothetical protein FOCC_FOCC013958 [Frankliniella occidentalis]|nr:hypothetical protein FOCC_FOCC013958 [Frankliniella occidentalis]
MLLECAKNNAGRKRKGWRYIDPLKEFCTIIFTLGGPQVYEILSRNLLLPAIPTCSRILYAHESIQEGVFRFKELKRIMTDRGYPTNKVILSEDGTVVTGRIQYDPKTNQVVGFCLPLQNGVPVPNSFPATSGKVIESYFQNGIVSKNAYVVMARPVSPDSTPFCVGLFGTDNRFSHLDVLSRWEWMDKEATKEGFQIVAHSADGDAKDLKAMVIKTFSPEPARKWPWLQASLDLSAKIMVQDTIHLLVKLKCKFLHVSDIMPMGKHHIVSRGHIAALIENASKGKHKLTASLLTQKDKMNFRSAQKLCDLIVCEELECVPGSSATITFLTMMREFCSAFLDVDLATCQRISRVFKWLFFVRYWRKWIDETDGYTLQHNFITANSFTCMEINAHALILMVRKFRDSEEPELFLPWLFSSQDCEDFFRKSRAMSPTQSTMVTFSILDLQHKTRRTDFLSQSFSRLKNDFEFPRLKKLYEHQDQQPHISMVLPEDYEIEELVQNSLQEALVEAVKFKIAKPKSKFPVCPLQTDFSETEEIISEDDNDFEIDDHTTVDGHEDFTDFNTFQDAVNENSTDDVEEDLLVCCTGSLGMRSFENVPLSPTSPFVAVSDGNGERCVIKKSSLIWLLSSGDTRISSDRLLRVQAEEVHHKSNKNVQKQQPFKEDNISEGRWYAFLSEDNSVVVGEC